MTYLIHLPHSLALFPMSLIQTARHKTAVLNHSHIYTTFKFPFKVWLKYPIKLYFVYFWTLQVFPCKPLLTKQLKPSKCLIFFITLYQKNPERPTNHVHLKPHTKLKILPPLLPGLKPETFQSQVCRSTTELSPLPSSTLTGGLTPSLPNNVALLVWLASNTGLKDWCS